MIHDLYGSNLGAGDILRIADIASAVFKVEHELLSWQASLPTEMKLVEKKDTRTPEGDALHWKFRVILTLRYHSLRILTHRPILDRHMQLIDRAEEDADEAVTLRQIGQLSKVACLDSARTIAGIVSICTTIRDRHGISTYLGAWWFSLYYSESGPVAFRLSSSRPN